MTNPTDIVSSGSHEVAAQAEGKLAAISEARSEALSQMMQHAAEEPLPIVKNLLLNGTDLLEMAVRLKNIIADAANYCNDIEGVQKIQPCIDTYLRTCKQAERILRLQHEIKRDR